MSATAKKHSVSGPNAERLSILHKDRRDIEKLYEVLRGGRAKLVDPGGETKVLPNSLHAFLIEMIQALNQGKPIYLIQNQATFTTIEAAAMLGVSRQFLVDLIKKGEIAHHMVGTHRRIYARDLLRYKRKRDELHRNLIRELAKAEAESGLYEKIPPTLED